MRFFPSRSRAFPACYLALPPSAEGRRAAFYLAAEEYVARTLPTDHYLFSWVLSPTVVMGRNQVAEQEVNLPFCRAHGIDIIRRKSGGGSIFADPHNIMLSLVAPGGAVEPLFAEYATAVAQALQGLGAPVEVAGRNDLVLRSGGKVCGNAFYHLPHRNIVHGTMLLETDLPTMAQALTPAPRAQQALGVKSVRSRVGALRDYLSMDVPTLRQALRERLTNRTVQLTDDDLQAIKAIEADYYDPLFLFGKRAVSGHTASRRIPACGRIALTFTTVAGRVETVALSGDYFDLGTAAEQFARAFTGAAFTREGLHTAAATHHPERAVRGLTAEVLGELLDDALNQP